MTSTPFVVLQSYKIEDTRKHYHLVSTEFPSILLDHLMTGFVGLRDEEHKDKVLGNVFHLKFLGIVAENNGLICPSGAQLMDSFVID